MPADPNAPEPTQNANEPARAPEPAQPQQDYEALRKQFEETQGQLRQAAAALAAIQAEKQNTQQAQPEPEITPEFQAQADAFFQRQLAPFLQQMDQRLAQIGGWQSGQQLRQLSQEIELPNEVELETAKLMSDYAQAGRPISYQTAVRHVLGLREENRLRQEAATRRSKQQFNSSMLPAFTGSGGLPNLRPLNGQRPKDNDLAAWAALADQNDLPL